MRYVIILAALLCGPAFAEDSPYLKGDALQAEITRDCADGCIVFAPAEVAALEQAIKEKLVQAMQQAYAEGKKQGELSCRNAI